MFASYDLLELELDAPFNELIASTQAEADYAVTGRLTVIEPGSGRRIEIPGVKISSRGHTSRRADECDFPKLKIGLPRNSAASIFKDMKSVKIGTHCGERGDRDLTRKFGRLANEKEPHREALAYRVLAAIGVPTLRARPARITYIFSDGDTRDRKLVRNAMLLEDDEAAVRRYGATSQIGEDRFESAQNMLSRADAARVAFAEAMIGNFDWCLRFAPGDRYRCDDRHPLWNVLALVRDNEPALPLPYDFDLSGFVLPSHIWFKQAFSETFVPSNSPVEVEVLAQVQRTRSLFPREQLDQTRQEFLSHKGDALKAVREGVVDDEGRKLAEAYLTAFYDALKDAAFYRPVVVKQRARASLDAAQSRTACGQRSEIPVGTPVSDPIDKKGDLVSVRLLDALWQWAPPNECKVIHQQPVWIPAAAIDTNYPR